MELIERMDRTPFDFISNHQEMSDLKSLLRFKHRTFNDTDLLYFISFFRQHYQQYESLEDAFFIGINSSTEEMLNHFRRVKLFFFVAGFSAPHQKTRFLSAAKIYLQTPQHVFTLDGEKGQLRR